MGNDFAMTIYPNFRKINFVAPVRESRAPYTKILYSLIDPILKHLPGALITDKPLPGAVNVVFFIKNYKTPNALTVFLTHGIADKNWRTGKKTAFFDHVLVSGPAWRTKLIKEGIPAEKIHVTGWPKLDPLFQGTVKPIKRRPGDGRTRGVLWAPTHDAIQEVSSHPKFKEHFDNLPDSKYEKLTSVHPANGKGDPTMQLLADADVVISDTSGVVYEALALGKPVVFPDFLVKDGVLRTFKGTFEEQIYCNNIGWHVDSPGRLQQVVDAAMSGGMDEVAKNFIDSILPVNLRGTSGKATADVLMQLASK